MRFFNCILLAALFSPPSHAEIVPGGNGSPATAPSGMTVTDDGCANGNVCSGEFTITWSNLTEVTTPAGSTTAQYYRVGDTVTIFFRHSFGSGGHVDNDAWVASISNLPIARANFVDPNSAGGACGVDQAGASSTGAQVLSITGEQRIQIAGRFDGASSSDLAIACTIHYKLN